MPNRRYDTVVRVTITDDALAQVAGLPMSVKPRIYAVIERLERWPQVSGVKWLSGPWKQHARIRTGDYRVIFRQVSDTELLIVRIADRRDAYAD